MVNSEVLQRLQDARKKKEKKVPTAADNAKKKAEKVERAKAQQKKGGRSEKMKGIMAAIKPLYQSFLKEKQECEIKSPVCTGQSTCVHHTAGRGMENLMDMNTWEAACDPCNLYVEEHDAWARENGHKISKHAKRQ